MKLKSLILGSVAAAGLATGAQAADLGVLTSLDVCDALGLSGLTISSDTNCLQITGSVSYKFVWGDYKGDSDTAAPVRFGDDYVVGNLRIPTAGYNTAVGTDANLDWESKVEAWIQFAATADSDFGPAKAVIKLREIKQVVTGNEHGGVFDSAGPSYGFDGGDNSGGFVIKDAYVSIGDATVIMAGKKGSIVNDGDDEPFNWLGLFHSEDVDAGISTGPAKTGGHVIQVVSDLGNGVSVGVGLENLQDATATRAGTAVGVVSYAGEGISAHVDLLAGGILDGEVDNYAVHAGFTGSFEQFRIRGAFSASNSPVTSINALADSAWEAMASAEATFDMFKLAVSGEATSTVTDGGAAVNTAGFGASASAMVTDGITINLGGRWYDDNTATANTEGYQVAASLVAAVTETIKITGEVGLYGNNAVPALNVYYGAAEVAWAPGGGFTSSIKGEAYSNGAYRATFKAAKTFE